ncbi:MAG: short-chain dehydrogenase, partial [Candidatus Methylomirabilis sp.]|nr:short-chain dehydrogenase [Deltaproteobacteria bacterium]
PGGVASNFGTNNGRLAATVLRVAAPFLRTPEKGAETSVWLATSPEVEGVTGGYFTDCRRATPSKAARDEAAAKRLWDISARMTGVGA